MNNRDTENKEKEIEIRTSQDNAQKTIKKKKTNNNPVCVLQNTKYPYYK